MASATQLTSLIRAFKENDHERFINTAAQIAAHEESLGHAAVAHEIRQLLSSVKSTSSSAKILSFSSKEISNLDEFAITSQPKDLLSEIILSDNLRKSLERVLIEYRQRAKLYANDLEPRRRILLSGPPGTGKTLTSRVLAGELHLPLYTILMDRLITKFMGETSSKLSQIFSIMPKQRGVYLFDEFDAIGSNRSCENDVGEMRRVLNSFLQMLDQDDSDSIIVAATNTVNILDKALFRRFDDMLYYTIPDSSSICHLLKNKLGIYWNDTLTADIIVELSVGLSHAEITGACMDAKKDAILRDKNFVAQEDLRECILARKAKYESQGQ